MKEVKTNWTASVLLFSGRPNPEWVLTELQQKEWMQLWQQAPLSNTDVEEPSILGYTGCKLYFNEHSHWQLYNGCVSFFEYGKITSKKEDEKRMELFLLNTAPEEVKAALRDMKII